MTTFRGPSHYGNRGKSPRATPAAPRTSRAELAGTADQPSYEGILSAHQHFVECVRENKEPISSLRDVVKTCRLVDQLEMT